ncbi:MAG: DUF58 domain-containing protein [Methanobacteriota archaeon]
MLTRKIAMLGALAIALVVAGMYLQRGTLIVLSLVPSVYLALLAAFPRPVSLDVDASRSISETRVASGQRLTVTLRLANRSEAAQIVEVEDAVPDCLRIVSGSPSCLVNLEPGEVRTCEYAVEATKRGRHVLGPLRLRCADPSGVRDLERTLAIMTTVTAIAEVEPEREIRIAPNRTRNWVGQIVSRRIGIGSETWGLREYAQGDEMRHINWKATARTGRYITNEYEAERSGDVTIILDAREGSGKSDSRNSPIESSIRAVSTIGAHVLMAKNRVGLIVFRDCLDTVNPAFGKRQFYRISEKLLDVRSAGTMPFENVSWLVTKYFPVESLVVVVSPLADEGIVRAIADFCARGYDVVVVSPSPLVTAKSHGLDGIAFGVASVERSNILRELARYARVVDWNPDEPLATSLRTVSPRRGSA